MKNKFQFFIKTKQAKLRNKKTSINILDIFSHPFLNKNSQWKKQYRRVKKSHVEDTEQSTKNVINGTIDIRYPSLKPFLSVFFFLGNFGKIL